MPNPTAFLLPLLLGAFTVLQAGVNRKIAERVGLPAAVILNACWLALVGLVFFFATFKGAGLDRLAQIPKTFTWWYLLPGIMGLCLVWGIPMVIKNIGAQFTFILIISAQLLVSLLWDYWAEGRGIPPIRLIGCALAWAGALLVARSPA